METSNKENVFSTLYAVDVRGKTEKKNGLTYLSWAAAWAEAKKRFPDAQYTVYENAQGFNYHTDGRTAWVKTGVTIAGLEHIEYLPVMDFKNKSIPANAVTSYDVNKAIQRSLTKALARHGLGLYIYEGEDLPEAESAAPAPQKGAAIKKAKSAPAQSAFKGGEDTDKERYMIGKLIDAIGDASLYDKVGEWRINRTAAECIDYLKKILSERSHATSGQTEGGENGSQNG